MQVIVDYNTDFRKQVMKEPLIKEMKRKIDTNKWFLCTGLTQTILYKIVSTSQHGELIWYHLTDR